MTFPGLQFTHPPEQLTISDYEVHIWIARLDDFEADLLPFVGILEKQERRQGTRFHFERDRKRFLTKRLILKKLLSLYLDTPPQFIRFGHNQHGKPHLLQPTRDTSLQFSNSHSQGLAVYVFGRFRRLGVDLESLQLLPEVDTLLSRWFPHLDASILQNLATQEKHLAFYRLWTLKEAYLKALGKGLGGPEDFVDSFPDDLKTSWYHPSMEFYRMHSWSFQVLTPAPNFIATLAVDEDNYFLRCFEWEAGAAFRVQPKIRDLLTV
jgi:4'-phosphopantetheinyl transferase